MTDQDKAVAVQQTGQLYERVAPPRLLVYIASPYTVGDRSHNVRKSIITATMLGDYGYAAISPLVNHFQDLMTPRSHNFWLSQDLAVVGRCDVVLRLDGKSTGADIEVDYAESKGIPVVYSVDDLLEEFPP